MTLQAGQKLRLSNAHDFKRVFQHSCKSGTSEIVTYACLNQLNHPRVGFIIAKRQIPKAVKRNKIRRVIREYIRINQNFLNGVDFVIIVKSKILSITSQGLRHCLEKQLKNVVEKLQA